MEVENFEEVGFRGFLRIRVDLDTSKPLPPDFSIPYPAMGCLKIRLKYKGLEDFCLVCGRLGHSRGCQHPPNPSFTVDGWGFGDEMRMAVISSAPNSLFPSRRRKRVGLG
ncbi:unnamed protein product [Prunus armeniaca]|uniref:Uncharacterized protein n=1 Tax=Prunus armeniaca TaxID=36596 RepID=A0A6J5U0Q6_PRUAR|nr:unnamed protein product [Prunus armeniaca]